MTPEHYAQVKQIFLEACARAPAERESFLVERCGADAAIRAEIQALLAVHTEVTQSPAQKNGTQTAAADGRPRPIPARDFRPGAIVGERFRIIDQLGRGGMGEVYRAEDLRLNQTVALKFLPIQFATAVPWLERLHREVRLARTITHPNVCRVFDLNEAGGDYFISMEHVDGENLKSLLVRVGRLPGERAAQLAWQLCAGLAAAHAKGVLHRDLKPANVMLDGQGNIRILDFGLAALHDQVRGAEIRVGTPGYMAPEQLTGAGVSVRSDIYALGLVLYELYTGRPALPPAAMAGAAGAGAAPAPADRAAPAPPSNLVPDITPAAERAIVRCLEPDPANRPASVLELAAGLLREDALRMAQDVGETPSPTVVAAAGRSDISRRAAVALLLAFAAMLGAASLLSTHSHPLCTAEGLKPPEVLAEKAREYLVAGGLTPDAWAAYGFTGSLAAESELGAIAPTARFLGGTRELLFWYRNRSQPLMPLDAERLVFGRGRPTIDDPPFGVPGETAMVLDASGKLRVARLAPRPGRPHEAPLAGPDWSIWHRHAGLDPNSLQSTRGRAGQYSALSLSEAGQGSALSTSSTAVSTTWAWEQAGAADASSVRVHATSYDGQPTSYLVQSAPPDAAALAERADLIRRHTVTTTVMFVVLGGLGVLALPLARENLRRGRSDPRGAIRLAGFIFAIRTISGLLQTTHSPTLAEEFRLLTLLLTGAAGNAVLVCLYYLALEPFARRFAPHVLITWTRVLAGQFRDPLVGRDLLLGAVLGVAGCLLFHLEGLLSAPMGLGVRPRLLAADFFAPAVSLRQAFGFLVDDVRIGVHTALWIALMVVLLRHVLKRAALAGALAALLIALYLVPLGSSVATSIVFLGIGVGGGLAWAALRFGIVPLAVAIMVMILLLRLPVTLNVQAWYFESALLALAGTIAVAAYGFRTALLPPPLPPPHRLQVL